jgi:hypothetical protein
MMSPELLIPLLALLTIGIFGFAWSLLLLHFERDRARSSEDAKVSVGAIPYDT